MPPMRWEFVMSRSEFECVRSDPRLPTILRLAHVTSALALRRRAIMAPLSWRSPRALRDRYTALLCTGAMLHEGLQVVHPLSKYFRHLPAYGALAGLPNDSTVVALRRRFLKKVRDQIAFHFDESVMSEGVKRISRSRYVFAAWRGKPSGETYFGLADELLTSSLLRDHPDRPSAMRGLDRFMSGTADLFARFMAAAHRLIRQALREMGWREMHVPRSRAQPTSASVHRWRRQGPAHAIAARRRVMVPWSAIGLLSRGIVRLQRDITPSPRQAKRNETAFRQFGR